MPDSVALVLLPPPHIAALVDPLRSANDRSYARGWSAHITVLFPFSPVLDLPELTENLRDALSNFQPFDVVLNKVSRFTTRDYETVYLGVSLDEQLHQLWQLSVDVMKHPKDDNRPYTPHMTLGQTTRTPESIAFLTDKGTKILLKHDLSWQVDNVALMRRRHEDQTLEMYTQIPLGKDNNLFVPQSYGISSGSSYHFDGTSWAATIPSPSLTTSIALATYNILHDASFSSITRFPAIRDAILEANADIICLQEVADDILWAIMADPALRKQFRWCSRAEGAVMESERNVVLLAREDFGFEAVRVELGTHKAAFVARLHTACGILAIVGIHLTAGRAAPILQKKRQELSTLLAYLRLHHASDEWAVIGDTNWPDSEPFPFEDKLADVWNMTGGGTYDPTTNILAAATTHDSRSPQRYDRILLKRGGVLSAVERDLRLFGLPSPGQGPASDHWGVAATLAVQDPLIALAPKQTAPVPSLSILPTSLNNVELHNLCAEHSCFPSDDHNQKLAHAVTTLRNLLSNTSPSAPAPDSDTPKPATSPNASVVRLVVAPVGSFAMGYHNPGSDVDCVVVGNINPGTFWSLVRWKIRITAPNAAETVRLRRFVKDASVQMMELEVDGVKMDIQYCPAGKLIDCWSDLVDLPRDSPLFALPVSALRTLNAHRDALTLQKALPSLDEFRLAHRALKLFLKLHGLIGARFGYLGGFHLAFLLARICLLLPPTASASQIVRVFFRIYARWDWEHDMVTVPIPGVRAMTYRRSIGREPLCILSIEKPVVNMTVNANPHSVGVLQEVLASVDRALDEGTPWKEVCAGRNGGPPWGQFLKDHKSFVKIDVNYWGDGCMKGRALVGWLESRFVNLLVRLHADIPVLHARLWPSRFTDINAGDDQTLHGFYLMGLTSTSVAPKTEEEKQITRRENAKVLSSLINTLRTFEGELQQNARYYDPVDTFISVTNVGFSQLPTSVVLDSHIWSDNGFDEEEDEEDDDGDDLDTAQDDLSSINGTGTSQKKQIKDKKTPHVPASKLRTSSDVYNRLMWDSSVSSSDYVIGYEDRFKGVREMPLGSWKREVEDEAFIPFHRVVYFRRKSDNVLVWDRKTKTDLVFGSGTSMAPV